MEELESSVRAAQNAKALKRHIVKAFTAGHQPPAILNYVVAYDGPVKMNTVYNWIAPVYKALSITAPNLPPQWISANADTKRHCRSESRARERLRGL